MNISIEKLKSVLAYDSEEIKFLSISERCEIHRNIINLEKGKDVEFSNTTRNKIENKLIEIHQYGWEYVQKKWLDNNGILTLVRA